MMKSYHPYHMVSMSPWPFMIGVGVLGMMIGFIKFFLFLNISLLILSIVCLIFIMMLWWRDVVRESTYQGCHCSYVLSGMMLGMILFIISEVMFFISFFWAFFHSSLSPSVELGIQWPPLGVLPFNPFKIPMLNTVILLVSGIMVTASHQMMLFENWMQVKYYLMMTWLLGLYFLMLQMFEYFMASFSIADSVFGSIFFMVTGFHGFHVIIGTLFLFFMWLRIFSKQMTSIHHFGFEAAAWYWHFVDVVWLFLFSMVYWWSN